MSILEAIVKRKRQRQKAAFIFLLMRSHAAALKKIVQTVETRYWQFNPWTVNGLNAYPLAKTNTDTTNGAWSSADGNLAVTYGHRVWKRSSSGVETEITSGTPVAQCSKAVGDTTLTEMTATWNCPSTSLAATDAIVDRLYMKFGTGAWQLAMESITEQLGGQTLDAATWTFKCWYQREYISNSFTRGRMYFGSSTYNSRILNFTWTG